jgi:hypothetical protein
MIQLATLTDQQTAGGGGGHCHLLYPQHLQLVLVLQLVNLMQKVVVAEVAVEYRY